MFFDYEDALVCIAVMAGFLMCVGLLHFLRQWNRIWRILLILVAIFVLSDLTEHLARFWFHDLPRGANFYRVFLATPVVYGVYVFKQFASEHVHADTTARNEENR